MCVNTNNYPEKQLLCCYGEHLTNLHCKCDSIRVHLAWRVYIIFIFMELDTFVTSVMWISSKIVLLSAKSYSIIILWSSFYIAQNV